MTPSSPPPEKPVLCVGALTCDLMLHVPALPAAPGKVLAERSSMVAAGMATSAATAVARLGGQVALWASCGDDMVGDFLLAEIARDGIDVGLVRRLHGVPSATAAILVDRHGERVVVPYYDAELMSEPEALPPVADGAFSAVLTDVRWPSAAAKALTAARPAGIPAILDLDVGEPEVLHALAAEATHIIASEAGAGALTALHEPQAALDELSRRFGVACAVTCGEKGVYWKEPDRPAGFTPAIPVRAVDTNAAGDVFHGAYAFCVARGEEMATAIRFAAAAAAIKCTRYGGRSGAPAYAEVTALLGAV